MIWFHFRKRDLLWLLVKSLLGLALLSGCEPGAVTCTHDDGVASLVASTDTFTPDELEHLQNVAARWNAYAGHDVVRIVPGPTSPCGCGIVKFAEMIPGRQAEQGTKTGTIRIGPRWQCEYADPLANDGACFEGLIIHEVGHMLGLPHFDDDANGIMRRFGGVALDFSPADRAHCVAHGICSDGGSR